MRCEGVLLELIDTLRSSVQWRGGKASVECGGSGRSVGGVEGVAGWYDGDMGWPSSSSSSSSSFTTWSSSVVSPTSSSS